MTTVGWRVNSGAALGAWVALHVWTTGLAWACPPDGDGPRAVAAIGAAGDLTLGDGAVVKLMSILMPSGRDLPVPPSDWPAERQAHDALVALLDKRTVRLAARGSYSDRYGRRVAHAVVDGGPWIQGALVDAGLARVALLPGETECAPSLLPREAVARAKRVGLWSNPAYQVQQARDTRLLTQLTGTFQIIEGWVQAVGASRNEVFLNFGRDWRWDFTAALEQRRGGERERIEAQLKSLKGQRVRVRGFIQRRNGPFVALASTEAIEVLPEGAAGR